MKRPLIALIVAMAIALLLNIAGWNLYGFIPVGDEDLHLGLTSGMIHASIQERFESISDEDLQEFNKLWEEDVKMITLLKLSRFEIFLESRLGGMSWLWFRGSLSDRVIEVPQILFFILIVPALKLSRQPSKAVESTS
ncbi:MAG: hypothetical protein AAF571_12685 [Verrucomicrobiota bacterium]